LFGNQKRSKGLVYYALVAMVYAELKLERKVDWSTYPTTTQFLLLGLILYSYGRIIAFSTTGTVYHCH
jgi:hypothetical protein